MFTSKKAQYLNKDFDRISPITSIDSLYFEQAEVSTNSYIINRKSVAKHMPIKFNILNKSLFHLISSDISVNDNTDNILNLASEFKKTELYNLYDNVRKQCKYETSLFYIDVNVDVSLNSILSKIEQVDIANTSFNNINLLCNNLNSSVQKASDFINEVNDKQWNDLSNGLYNDELITVPPPTPVDNQINRLKYQANNNTKFVGFVKIQCVSIGENVYSYVPLNIIEAESIDTSYINKWVVNYDYFLNDKINITYLKDEFNNEGNYDFRNTSLYNDHCIYNGQYDYYNSSFRGNKLYLNKDDISNTSILFELDGTHINNEIYYSDNIYFGTSNYNNIIKNSYNINFNYDSRNNIIINSSNYICNISGSNNVIINCNDSSIEISGNNNYLINVANQNCSLGSNNKIININNNIVSQNLAKLDNDILFLNNSVDTANTLDLSTNSIIYGGINNDISVYVQSLRTYLNQ